MVRSENFNKVVAMIVVDDKQGVINFLRSQGIMIPKTANNKRVISSLYASFNSKKFAEKFAEWADKKYKAKEKNFSGSYKKASGDFDPMNAQSGGADVNFTGVNSFEQGSVFNETIPNIGGGSVGTPTTNPQSGTTAGNIIRDLGGIGGILNTGIGIWQSQEQRDQQQDALDAQLEAERLKLEQLKEQGKINQQQLEAQLKQAEKSIMSGGSSNTVLYVVGGVVLLGALGTAIYFATKK